MLSVTTEAAANVSFQGAQPSPQRGDRSSEDAFGTLVDASVQGSHAAVAQAGNPRDQFNVRPNVPRRDRVVPESTGDSPRAGGRADDQANAAAGSGTGIQKPSAGAEASNGTHHHRAKHDGTEVASTGEASDPMLVASDVITADQTTPQPVTTPPAVAVPVTIPVAATLLATATPPTATAAIAPAAASTGAAGVLPAQAAAPLHAAPADIGFNPTVAADTAAAMATILQQTTVPPDTQHAAQTTAVQTGGTLAAAVATAAPGAAKATVKTLDNAPPGKTTASVMTGLRPGPTAPDVTAPPAASGGPIAPHDTTIGDHKRDAVAADSAKTASSDTDALATQPGAAAPPHPARALDVAAPQPQPDQVEGQSINTVLAPPQIPSNATTPATPQYNVAVVAGAAVPLNGLAVQIAVTALSGKSRFEIRLDPADLGRIDVRLDVDRQGRVTSHLTVEKPETLAMLRQDAPQLHRALQDAGLKTGDGGLQFSLRDQSSQQQNARDGSGRHNQRLIVTEENIPVAAAGRDYGRILGSNRGLDIRV